MSSDLSIGYMRNLQTVKPKVSHLVNKNGNMTATDEKAAEVLCEPFKEVFVIDNEDDLDAGMTRADTRKIPMYFERDKVKDLLLSLKTDPGPGGLHPIVLQKCAEEISLPMSLIFQKSFHTGQLPTDWKLAVVSPIFKKGKKCDAGNYRPVSLTSVPCKIMETIKKMNLSNIWRTVES